VSGTFGQALRETLAQALSSAFGPAARRAAGLAMRRAFGPAARRAAAHAVRSAAGVVARSAPGLALCRVLNHSVQHLGYSVRHSGRMVHRLAQAAIALALLLLLTGGALAWRLAQGPMEVDWLARRLQAAVNGDGTAPALEIGHAALAWEGFTLGVDRPLDILLTDLALRDAAGLRIAELPRAELSLSAGWLMLGRIVPRALELDGVRLQARRGEDGGVSIDLGRAADDAAAPALPVVAPLAAGVSPATSPAAGPGGVLAALLQELARPAETDTGGQLSRWVQLRRVRIRNASLTVDDRQLGGTWRASQVGLDVMRRDQGGAEADGELTFALGEERVLATLHAALPAGGGSAAAQLHLAPVTPARLAALAPGLAALAVLDAPLALSATATVGADLIPAQVKLQARIGEGRLLLGHGSMPLAGALVEAEGSLADAVLRVQRLELTSRPDAPRTTLRGSLHVIRAGGRLDASIAGDLDQVPFADLAALWPAGVGGRGTRPWITENVTDGIARNGHFELHLTAPEDLSEAQVSSLSGGLDGQDLTVHWLRPVPPVEHASGRLSFLSPDMVEILVAGGRQAGGTQGGLALQSGRVRIVGLAGHNQFLTVEADLAGPVADLLTVLKHPRLHLLDRRPMDIRDPSGTVTGRLTVTRLPLKTNLTVDDVHVQAAGKVILLHLGGIVGGRDIDQGTLEFDAGNDGLKMRGTSLLGGIPAQMQLDLDFHNGGPAQVLQKMTVAATANGRQLASAGLDTGGVLDGPAVLQATLLTRRDGSGEALVQGDLGRAELSVPRLNFRKPAGQPASAEMHLTMAQDEITGIDRLRVDGDGIAVAGRVVFADGWAQTVQLDRVRLGNATDASGEVHVPGQPGGPWVATLTGHSLDASAEFRHGDATATPREEDLAEDQPGPPWRVQARFDQVLLGGDGRMLTGVACTAESDGRVIRQGRLTGQTGAGAAFRADIVPGRFSRTVTGTAEDAGGLLSAFDVLDDMRGGRLTVRATYDDRARGHPLQGTAEIVDFRMRNAPALAKLLQAMTLYGVAEVLEGPGLGFSRMVAPFRLSRDELELADARAFSASLGMTAKGRVDFSRHTVAVDGTIVPAYFFNTLLGEIPLIGRLFSPERGGGVFAATYSMNGPLDDPAVSVNPLAALTPGFLRGLFGMLDGLTGSSASSVPGGGGAN
jgi:hypothetical protein